MKFYPFGEALTELLNSSNRSASWLAREISVSPSTVNRWINEQTRPSDIQVVLRIADIFKIYGEEREQLVKAAGYEYFDSSNFFTEKFDQKESENDLVEQQDQPQDQSRNENDKEEEQLLGQASLPNAKNSDDSLAPMEQEPIGPTENIQAGLSDNAKDAFYAVGASAETHPEGLWIADKGDGNSEDNQKERFSEAQEPKLSDQNAERLNGSFPAKQWHTAILVVITIIAGMFLSYLLFQTITERNATFSNSDGNITIGGTGNVVNIVQPTSPFVTTNISPATISTSTPTMTQTSIPESTDDALILMAEFESSFSTILSTATFAITETPRPIFEPSESGTLTNQERSPDDAIGISTSVAATLTAIPTATSMQVVAPTPMSISAYPCDAMIISNSVDSVPLFQTASSASRDTIAVGETVQLLDSTTSSRVKIQFNGVEYWINDDNVTPATCPN